VPQPPKPEFSRLNTHNGATHRSKCPVRTAAPVAGAGHCTGCIWATAGPLHATAGSQEEPIRPSIWGSWWLGCLVGCLVVGSLVGKGEIEKIPPAHLGRMAHGGAHGGKGQTTNTKPKAKGPQLPAASCQATGQPGQEPGGPPLRTAQCQAWDMRHGA
jgi:hypothetical protein